MGKHHAEPWIKEALRRAVDQTRTPSSPPTVLLGSLAIVAALGSVGGATRVEFERGPNAVPTVVSTRPPLIVPSGAAGDGTEPRTQSTPVRSPAQRSRTVENSPSAPVRDRAAPSVSTPPSPQATPSRSSSPAPQPTPKRKCRRHQ